jgi:hypothetical protein
MTPEIMIVGIVRQYATDIVPLQPALATCAVELAFQTFAAGASVSEACAEARTLLENCARLPSCAQPYGRRRLVRSA